MKAKLMKQGMKKAFALALSLLVMVSMLVPSSLQAFAEGNVLPIAQYVTQEGNAQCATDGKSATYSGTVKMNVSLSDVLAAKEVDMKKAADNGLYPHGKEGRNKIAYIEYNVIFPVAVNVGDVKVSNTSSIINSNKIVKNINGNTVNFKMYLKDENWKAIYNYYLADKANPSAHTVNIEIPYSIQVNSKEDAIKYEAETITGKGDFSFYLSGTGASFGFGLQTFNSDVAKLNFAKDISNCFEEEAPKPPQEIVKEDGKLPGDILIGEETQHTKVYESKKDASHDFTGKLFVESIKAEMKAVEIFFNNPEANDITLSDMDTSFTTTITLPEEMEFASDMPEFTLEGVNDKFEVTDKKLSNKKVTLTMSLKDKENIKTYADLKKAIDSVENELRVTVKGAKFTDKAKADTEYKVIGEVSGEFKATATKKDGNSVKFTYKWKGEQKEDGADSTDPTSKNISFTLKYKEPAPQQPQEIIKEDGKLPGDILIGEETQHTKVYESTKDASHDFTGKLFVKSIKEEMKAVEKFFNNPNATDISLSDMNTSFTATITLPEEMEFGSETPEFVLEGVSDKFEVTDKKLSKKKVTLTMSLKDKANIKTYADLKTAIDSVEDELKVTVKGAKFTDKAKADTNYKVTGEVSGEFNATATKKSGKAVKFTYKWKGEQKEDGADSTDPTSKNISFTLKYKEPAPQQPQEIVKEDGKLPGDILIGEETQHTKVYESTKDASHDFTGKLFVESIKAEMKAVEIFFNNPEANDITLSDMDTSFTTTITLPEEMEFASDMPEFTLEGVNDKFEVTDKKLSNKKVTLTMSLKDKENIKTYADLKKAIDSVENELRVTVKGAKFTDKAKADTEYKVIGEVSGEFKATATKKDGNSVKFTYKWKGEQKEDGADSTAPTSKNISFTLKYKEAAPEDPNVPQVPNDNPGTNKPEKPTNSTTHVKPANPVNTADNTDLGKYVYVLLSSAFVLTVLSRRANKREE